MKTAQSDCLVCLELCLAIVTVDQADAKGGPVGPQRISVGRFSPPYMLHLEIASVNLLHPDLLTPS